MVFIIGIVIGILGLGTLLFVASASRRHRTNPPIAQGDEWFSHNITRLESHIQQSFEKGFRIVVKNILLWMVDLYRSLARKITVKELAKKKIRQFLSDQNTSEHRTPSAFWKKVTEDSEDTSLH